LFNSSTVNAFPQHSIHAVRIAMLPSIQRCVTHAPTGIAYMSPTDI